MSRMDGQIRRIITVHNNQDPIAGKPAPMDDGTIAKTTTQNSSTQKKIRCPSGRSSNGTACLENGRRTGPGTHASRHSHTTKTRTGRIDMTSMSGDARFVAAGDNPQLLTTSRGAMRPINRIRNTTEGGSLWLGHKKSAHHCSRHHAEHRQQQNHDQSRYHGYDQRKRRHSPQRDQRWERQSFNGQNKRRRTDKHEPVSNTTQSGSFPMLSFLSVSFSSRPKNIRTTARSSDHSNPNCEVIGLNPNTATTTVLRKPPSPTKPLHNIMENGAIRLMTWPRTIGKNRHHRGS